MGQFFLFPVPRQAQNAAPHGIPNLIVQPDFDIVLHREFVKQADILEGSRNASTIYLSLAHILRIHTVEQNGAAGWLIDLCEQVEYRGLTRTIGTNQTCNLRPADGHIEIVHRRQAAKVNAQMLNLQNGMLIDVSLRNNVRTRHRYHLRLRTLLITHCRYPPSTQNPVFVCGTQMHTCRLPGQRSRGWWDCWSPASPGSAQWHRPAFGSR